MRVQQQLVAFHRADDDGDWFAVCCKRGAEQALGRRLKPNEMIAVELTVREISDGDDLLGRPG